MSLKDERILVTGSDGFLAKNFINFLSKNNIHPYQISRTRNEISVIRADMSKSGSWQDKIKSLSPNVIIHFAGPSRPADEDDVNNNMLSATSNLLNSLEGCSVFFLHISSSAVYGKSMNEKNKITEDSKCLTTDLYGEGKLKQEKLLINFANQNKNKFELCICRPTNVIGLGQSSSFFVGKLMNSLKEISNRDDFDIKKKYQISFGSLDSKRDFLDVRDLNSILYKLSSIKPTGTFNISRGEDFLLRDLVDIVIEKSFIHAEITENKEKFKTNNIKKQMVSSKKLNKLIDWKGHLPIDKTLNDIMGELKI